ncbi:MAG: hypothetical protein D6725_15180 [Planctomycetota bacterium]|nr:MAG: hypothetical protein D6725_15180 [Planctomycetota bacterium]
MFEIGTRSAPHRFYRCGDHRETRADTSGRADKSFQTAYNPRRDTVRRIFHPAKVSSRVFVRSYRPGRSFGRDWTGNETMGRWPDSTRATIATALLLFVVFPLLCWLAWWWVGH